MTFNMEEPTLKNSIDQFKPIFKSWNEVSQMCEYDIWDE